MQAIQQQVGLRLRALREAQGLSQEDLAAACNLHRTYVGLIERGERNISISTIEQLAAGLGISPAVLFADDSQGTPSVVGTMATEPKRASVERIVAAEANLHVAVIRQLLIKTSLTTPEEYQRLIDAERRRHAKQRKK